MIRLTIYMVIVLLVSVGASWVMEHDGTLTISWFGYQIDASMTVVVIVLCVVILIITLVLYLLLRLRLAVIQRGAFYREKRRNAGLESLSQGLILLAAGDMHGAKKLLERKAANQLPACGLLQAHIARAEGQHHVADDYLAAMLPYENTELVALRGLAARAYEQRHYQQALQLAEKARAINPDLKWVLLLLADLYYDMELWPQSYAALERAVKRQHISITQALPKMAELLIKQEKTWRAVRLLKQGWAERPHPQIMEVFLLLYPQATPQKRLHHVEAFVKANHGHAESALAVARMAIEAGAFDKARENVRIALAAEETKAACMLMAELEKMSGASAQVEKWLRRALQAEEGATEASAPHASLGFIEL